MSRIKAKRASKEFAALAKLKDSEIDTSDIPELADWSQAMTGRFRHAERRAIAEEATALPSKRSVAMTHNVNVRHLDYGTLSSSELITACL